MKKILIGLIVLVVYGLGVFVLQLKFKKTPTSFSAEQTTEPTNAMENTTVFDEQIDLTSQKTVEISIENYKYIPNNIKIKKGTKVTWTNKDAVEHNAMRAHEGDEKAHNVEEDEHNENVFEGPMLKTGESYTFVFNEASLQPYHCAPHPWMQGKIEVVE